MSFQRYIDNMPVFALYMNACDVCICLVLQVRFTVAWLQVNFSQNMQVVDSSSLYASSYSACLDHPVKNLEFLVHLSLLFIQSVFLIKVCLSDAFILTYHHQKIYG